MLTIIALSVVVACSAQHSPPHISETFAAEIISRVHMGPRGMHEETGRMDHDSTNNRGAIKLEGERGMFQRISLYHHNSEESMSYTIESSGNQTHCQHQLLRGNLPPHWEFLMHAHFRAETEYMGKKALEFGFEEQHRGEGVILVDAMDTSIPLLVNHTRQPDFAESTEYRTFMPGAPPATDFEIPAVCHQRRV